MSRPGPDQIDAASVALALQTALRGEVTPILRGVAFQLSGTDVDLQFYYAEAPSAEGVESASMVETELLASLPENYATKLTIIVAPPGNGLPVERRWVYRRREA